MPKDCPYCEPIRIAEEAKEAERKVKEKKAQKKSPKKAGEEKSKAANK